MNESAKRKLRVGTNVLGEYAVEALLPCINGLSAWTEIANFGRDDESDQMFAVALDRPANAHRFAASEQLLESCESVARLVEIGIQKHSLEARRHRGSFGIANDESPIGLEWQALDDEECAIREAINAAIRAAKEGEMSEKRTVSSITEANWKRACESEENFRAFTDEVRASARRAGKAEGLREGARLASEFCDAIAEKPQKAAAATISGLLLARAEEVERNG